MVSLATVGGVPFELEIEVGEERAAGLLVLGFEGEEELSRPFRLDVTAVGAPDVSVDPAVLVAQRALFRMHGPDGSARVFHGVVAEVEAWQAGVGDAREHVRLRIVPRLWTLGERRRSRIFQGRSVPEIVGAVLDETGVKHRAALSATYPAREYCVQYGETDLDFVSRLLEEEGIFYFFEQGEKEEVVVLADANSAFAPIAGIPRVPFRDPSGLLAEGEYVDAFSARLETRTGTVQLRDYDYQRPTLDLTITSKAGRDQELESYEYPGGYADPGHGTALAKVRLEQIRARAEVMRGSSVTRRLATGFRFELDDHPVAAMNDAYLVVRAEHRADQPEVLKLTGVAAGPGGGKSYRNEFHAIRATVPYRAPRRAPRPLIPGAQTARVTGPDGEEVHTDELGRVKVRFHWDRDGATDDRSSCWVRVSQAWAGAGWGALFVPRIGQEVVVEFLDGNPDRPIVTGAVYNGMNPPPVALPGEKTRSTIRSATSPGGEGSNELRFDDAKGSEEIHLHAQKALTVVVEHDASERVGGTARLTVGKDRERVVGGSQTLSVGRDDAADVRGNLTLGVGGDRTVTVGGNDSENVTGDQRSDVGGARTIRIAGDDAEDVGMGKTVTVAQAYALNVAAAMDELVGADKSEDIAGARSTRIGADATESIGGSRTVTIGKDLAEQVAGNRTLGVGGDLTVGVGGNLQETAGGSYVLKAKELTLSADDQFVLKVGSATIEVASSGDVVIKGASVAVKASGDVVLKGTKITQN